MAGPLIEVDDLWKSFGRVQAIRGLCLRLESGQIHGLLGPNGSGKTTTLKCVVGLLKPDRGTVKFNGREITTTAEYKSSLGYLPENPALPDYLTVEEFLVFSAKLKGLKAETIRKEVNELLDSFGLVGVSDRLLYELSKGMKQRAAVAASLIGSPTVLILDEPFNGLDPEAQKTAKDYFNQVIRKGGAVLISTHLLDSAEKICNYASIIYSGKVLHSSSLDSLKQSHDMKSLEEIFLEMISNRRFDHVDN
ncbi:MAG: ABC transporter ATP-binding protein [Candidatus Caldarchaeum sp.]